MKKYLAILLIVFSKGLFAQTLFNTRVTNAATTVGANIFTLTNPSAITFLRVNADNTVSALNASTYRTAIGAGTGSGDALVANPLSQFASTTSAQLATVLSDETGTGLNVFATSPTLVTPTLGVATATSINGVTISSTTGTLNIANSATLQQTGAFNLNLTVTAATTPTFPTGTGTLAYLAGSNSWTATNTFATFGSSGTPSQANFYSFNASSIGGTQSTGTLLFAGASSVQSRVLMAGSTSTTLTAGTSEANFLIAEQGVTESTSGTHAEISAVVIKPQNITNGTATTTNAATVHITGAPIGTATITNAVNALLVDSAVKFNGSLTLPYVAKTAAYAVNVNDYAIDCTANTFSVILPTAVGITGKTYVISNSGSGTITISTTSSQVFQNSGAGTSTSLSLSSRGSFTVISTGANWIVQ